MKGRWILFLTPLVIFAFLIMSSNASAAPPADRWSTEASVKTQVRGAALHGTNGMYFGPDGELYVASARGGEIIVLDPDTGKVLKRIGNAGTPDDLTFGPDGSLYWTDIMAGNVWKMLPDGRRQAIATGLPGANPITFSEDGRLFIARDFFGVGLYEVDPQGVNPPIPILPDLVNLNGFAFGPDGWLYGPLFSAGQVAKINVNTGQMVTVAQGLKAPAAVKFNSHGRLFLVDQGASQVYEINLTNGHKTVVGRLTEGLDNLAIDSRDRIFVSNADDGYVARLEPSGVGHLISQEGVILPTGTAVRSRAGGGGSAFVGDVWTLREFDRRTGRALFSQLASVIGNLTQPVALAWDGQYILFGSRFGTVQIDDPQANQVLRSYPIKLPLGVTGIQGDVIVSNLGRQGQVIRVAQDGTISPQSTPDTPTGFTTQNKKLWVAVWPWVWCFRLWIIER